MADHDPLGPLRALRPPDETTVDVHRAMRAGRRRLRVRQAAVPAAGAAVLVVLLGLLTLVPHRGGSAAITQGPASFPVLARQFDIGSAAGFTPESFQTGRLRQTAQLRPAKPGTLTGQHATVTLYAPGRAPTPAGAAAEPVYGHRALLVDPPVHTGAAVELAWEWTPGGWAFVDVRGPGASRGQAHTIALSVAPRARPATPEPVRATPPAGLHLVGMRYSLGAVTPRFAEVLFAATDTADTGLAAGVTDPAPSGPADATVGGRPATVGPTRVSLVDGSGFYAAASDPGSGGATVLRGMAAGIAPGAGIPAG